MRRYHLIGLAGIALAACTQEPSAPDAPASLTLSAAVRFGFPLFEQFDDINPCSGQVMTVTINGTVQVTDQAGRELVRIQEELSTSDGFSGPGNVRDIFNGRNEILRINDMLSSESGARFRVQRLLVADVVNGELRVTSGGPVLTCIRP
jgi:hypothetical protein